MNSSVLIGGSILLLAWGVYGVVAKIASRELGLQAILWSYLGGAILIPLYLYFFKEMLPLKLDSPGIAWGIGAGILGGIGTMALYLLLRDAPASVVIPISALYPVVTVILAFIFLHEELTLRHLGGIALAVIAIWLLSA